MPPRSGHSMAPRRAGGHQRPRVVTPHGRTPVNWRRGLAVGQRVLVVGLALAVLAAFAAGTVEQRWKAARLRDQVTARQAALATAQARNAALKSELASANPDAYRAWVETTARHELNLAYPSETVYLVNWTDPAATPTPAPAASAGSPPATPPAPTPPEPNWQRWLRLLTGS